MQEARIWVLERLMQSSNGLCIFRHKKDGKKVVKIFKAVEIYG